VWSSGKEVELYSNEEHDMSLAAGTIALPLVVAVFDWLFENVNLDSYGHSCAVITYIERLFASLFRAESFWWLEYCIKHFSCLIESMLACCRSRDAEAHGLGVGEARRRGEPSMHVYVGFVRSEWYANAV
jgi:hypothetical protein